MILRYKDTFISDNSKEIKQGSFFLKTKQNEKFSKEAQEKGAKIIDVDECKNLLGISKDIKIIGISGTNGKTTTSTLLYELLLNLGYKCSLCGTRGVFSNYKTIAPKSLTTPAILSLLSFLQESSLEKNDFFIMEVSSHAIAQERIQGLNFFAKIFTNLSKDHLDFHKSFENYKKTKESFFKDEGLKIINADENIAYNKTNSISYGQDSRATYQILSYELKEGISAKIKHKDEIFDINSQLVGLFNLYNILAAISLLKELGIENDRISKALSSFKGVEGRMQLVAKNIIVDFAHSPDGIEKVLSAMKDKNLIVLFGAGGNRDKSKRALMAKIAKKYASKLIITSDNPRDEEPLDIIADILSGIEKDENVFVQVDRKKAIQKALELKKNDDFLLVLGKGDEKFQEIKGVKYPFNDKEVILELLTKLA